MARKRMIDPNIWQSEQLGVLPRDARLLFIGMFSNADDEGRLKASAAYLKAIIFPYDNDMTFDKVSELRDMLVNQGLIKPYQNSKGAELLFLPTWKIYQRIDKPQPSNLPEPPQIDECSTNVRRTFVPRVVEDSLVEDSLVEKRGGGEHSTKISRIKTTSPSESEIEESLSEGDREVISVWHSVRGFDLSMGDCVDLVAKLRTEFPDIDILAESKAWVARKLSEPLAANSRASSQIWNWMRKAREFGERRVKGDAKKARRVTGGRSASDFERGFQSSAR